MKIDKYKVREEFLSEDDDYLTVSYSNRGEPYSQGIEVEVGTAHNGKRIFVYLEKQEALRLAKLINDLYS